MKQLKSTHQFSKEAYTHLDNPSETILGLFPDINTLTLPTLVTRDIQRLLSSKITYSTICNNQTEAIEKCLYFISNLTSTLFTEDGNYWKKLNYKILSSQDKSYLKVKKFLINNNIIEVKKVNGIELYEIKKESKQYKLNNKYLKRAVTTYNIKTASIITIKNTLFYETYNQARNNPICDNLLQIYPKLVIPTEKEIKDEAKKLIKEGYITNKGKILTMKNKHKKEYWKDADNRSFVEDTIDIFKYLTGRGFMLPAPGSWKSGGRVVDSFSLMPSWVRNMITVNGKRLVQADYTCLHPNIASTIYGGTKTHINHDVVANALNIDRMVAKIEHLSFFNKRWSQMENSPLLKYYLDNEPKMMEKIKHNKTNESYKKTSKDLFEAEVTLMSETIIRLNREKIYALYVYDAWYVQPKDLQTTITIMNQVAKDFNINTKV